MATENGASGDPLASMVMDAMAPMEQWSTPSPLAPMAITIGANGDGVLNWHHYVHHHWSQWIAIGTIFWP
jgi:hypothetical protein